MQHECKAIVAFRFEFRFARKSLQRIKNYLLAISKYLSSRIAFRFYPLKSNLRGKVSIWKTILGLTFRTT